MVWLLSLSKVHGKKVGSNLIHEPKAEENLIGKKWKWSRSVMSNSVTKWTVAHQAPLSKGFSRQEYRVGCHSLLQGIFPPRDGTWVSRIAGKCFTLWATREAHRYKDLCIIWLWKWEFKRVTKLSGTTLTDAFYCEQIQLPDPPRNTISWFIFQAVT